MSAKAPHSRRARKAASPADEPITEPSRPTQGFGFDPRETEHHFLVTIPANEREPVAISEHFSWHESAERRALSLALGNEDQKLRVILTRDRWNGIAEDAATEFNQRLRRSGLRTGKWQEGQTPLARLFGKELVLLAWAVEDADPALLPVALWNWRGLSPEERWWLFTMTNAATGHAVSGRNKGWRKALRYALTENPVSEVLPDSQRLPFQLEPSPQPVSSPASKPKRPSTRARKPD